ncbi:hypothetical protein ACF1BS_07090 [Streptomyces sp. NPDC014748]|uniref:hypothetical protein n=1 Tax=Streptomyces sp. NPDC014748 TaxID=3364905 RepID=UPI0037019CD6
MFSIPENQGERHQDVDARPEHHQDIRRDIDLRLAGVERELGRIAEQKAAAKRERRRLRRARRAHAGRTPARVARTAFHLLLVVTGAVAFVVGGVMVVMGVPGAKTFIDIGTAAWGLASAFPAK